MRSLAALAFADLAHELLRTCITLRPRENVNSLRVSWLLPWIFTAMAFTSWNLVAWRDISNASVNSNNSSLMQSTSLNLEFLAGRRGKGLRKAAMLLKAASGSEF
eukprot:1978794-Pyramimonas_sp.AAC.1